MTHLGLLWAECVQGVGKSRGTRQGYPGLSRLCAHGREAAVHSLVNLRRLESRSLGELVALPTLSKLVVRRQNDEPIAATMANKIASILPFPPRPKRLDPLVKAVLDDVLRVPGGEVLRAQLAEILNELVNEAVREIAKAILLAKTTMPDGNADFADLVRPLLCVISMHDTLRNLGLLIIDAEEATIGDVFRDRTDISDELFELRLDEIRHLIVS